MVMGANESSILQKIFREQWKKAKTVLRRRLPSAVFNAVVVAMEKAIACGTTGMGFVQYRCEDCGKVHKECFSCKSRFCPRCGKAAAAEAAAQAQGRLLNVQHRHLTFAVPQELRPLLFEHRELLSIVAKAAAMATIELIGKCNRKHPPLPGVMATVHTFGRDLHFHVHVHVLVTAGGLREDEVWQPVKIFNARLLRKLWQYYLLSLLRRKLKGNRAVQCLIGRLFHQYDTGFIVNVMSIYNNGRKAAQYCCRYTGRPPLSEKRIVAYDGQEVTISYRDYRDGVEKELKLPAVEFLVQLLQHVWPRYQRSVHYYGLYQPPRRKEHAKNVVKASRYGEQALPVPPLSRRERLLQALGIKETVCPRCGGPLIFEGIHYRRKRYHGKAPPCQASSDQSKGAASGPGPTAGQLLLPVPV